jgi:hypothetical protein
MKAQINETKRMQQLAGILKEDFNKKIKISEEYPFIKKMVERDNPRIGRTSRYRGSAEGDDEGGTTISDLAYDFGGGENPVLGKNVTVVDIDSYDWENDIEDFKFIKANLTKKQNLPPVNMIIANDFLSNVLTDSNIKNIVHNIDNSLNEGGLFILHDWPFQLNKIIEYLQSYKLLQIYLTKNVAEAILQK